MIEEPRSAPPADAEAPGAEFASNQAMESAALAGAAAIQRLVAECNGLRTRVALQDAELARLRGVNDGVRRRFAMLHQRYVELAKKILGQLEQFDGLIRETGQEALSETARPDAGRHEEPIVLGQQPQEGTDAAAPKPNGRDIAGIMAQAPRAPAR